VQHESFACARMQIAGIGRRAMARGPAEVTIVAQGSCARPPQR
jgi:hypothetical protein